jgi:hypothetical protein
MTEAGTFVVPSERDVILGRGVLHKNHPGNIRFYAIIDHYLKTYIASDCKAEKSQVIHDIYAEVCSTGNFVREEPGPVVCMVVDEETARKKIGHAIRYRLKRHSKKSGNATSSSAAARQAAGRVPGRVEGCSLFSTEELDSVLGSPDEVGTDTLDSVFVVGNFVW